MPGAAEPHEADPNRPNFVWSTIRGAGRLVLATLLRYEIRGLEHVPHRGGALLLINHQSFLDPLLVGTMLGRPISFLARRTLFDVPVVGWILRRTYVIPLDREAVNPSSIKEGVARMKSGFLVGIFPEGTRTHDGEIGPFLPGFVTLVRRAGVPVIPVGIAGAYECFPRTGGLPRLTTIRTIIGPPLDSGTMSLLEERRNDEFVALARQRVVDCQAEAEAYRRHRP